MPPFERGPEQAVVRQLAHPLLRGDHVDRRDDECGISPPPQDAGRAREPFPASSEFPEPISGPEEEGGDRQEHDGEISRLEAELSKKTRESLQDFKKMYEEMVAKDGQSSSSWETKGNKKGA